MEKVLGLDFGVNIRNKRHKERTIFPLFIQKYVTSIIFLSSICIVQAQETTRLDTINVTKKKDSGYSAKSVAVGPMAEKPLIDTPYSIHVLPQDLLQNQQMKSVRDAFRYLSSVQGDNIRPQTRGLQAGVVQNTRIDGMNIASTTDYPIEQFERIEILNGLSGALYGPSNPAGTFNFVLKRPTYTPLYNIGVGYTNYGQASVVADLSSRFGKDEKFGYRLNLLNDSGDGYSENSSLDRRLFSLAFDFNFTDNTYLETNFSYYHYTSKGLPGNFVLDNQNIIFPSVPNPKRAGYGQPFGGDDNITKTQSAKLVHHFNDNWKSTIGVLHQTSDRESSVPINKIINNQGDFNVSVFNTSFTLDEVASYIASLNGELKTASLRHDIVLSSTGFKWDRYRPYVSVPVLLGTSNIDDPVIFDKPEFPDFKNRYRAQTTKQYSFTIGDNITFNSNWMLGVFLSHSQINQSGRTATGTPVGRLHYDDSGISKNVTLTYKPKDNMSLYGTYADSLQQGEALNDTILAPYRSEQYELGVKADFSGLALNTAIFNITRPFAYEENGVFAIRGEQLNRGLELMLNGSPIHNFDIFGGVSYLKPILRNTANANTSNKQIMGLPNWTGNILFDYKIQSVSGLAFNYNICYVGPRYANHINSYKIGGHTVSDLGVRYIADLWKYPVTWKLMVNNIADKHYWANITPSGQNGYSGGGTGNATIGQPRMIYTSLSIDF